MWQSTDRMKSLVSYMSGNHFSTIRRKKTWKFYRKFQKICRRGKARIVKTLVQQAVDEGIPAKEILEKGLLSGMDVVGEKFKNNEVYVPEVLVAARAMNMGVAVLKPLLADAGSVSAGKVCIGTVKGDLHDIGKNLVKMMMEGKGLEVVDLGNRCRAGNLCGHRRQPGLSDHLLLCSADHHHAGDGRGGKGGGKGRDPG